MPVDINDETDIHIHWLIYDWLSRNKADAVEFGLDLNQVRCFGCRSFLTRKIIDNFQRPDLDLIFT